MSQSEEINWERYYTEHPATWGEYPGWVEWASGNNCVGYGDLDSSPGGVEWMTHVNPTFLRQFAELLEFAYGYELHNGERTGSVELGVSRREDGQVHALVAREHDEAEKGLVCMTRIDGRGETDGSEQGGLRRVWSLVRRDKSRLLRSPGRAGLYSLRGLPGRARTLSRRGWA